MTDGTDQTERTNRTDRRNHPGMGGRGFFWRRLLWGLVFPRQTERVRLTVSGGVLIALAVGVGVAAYNAASNILFITLSLLLGCMILSGVLAWLNFRRVSWWLEIDGPMRAGRAHPVALRVRNAKRFLPAYGLAFEVAGPGEPKTRRVEAGGRIDPAGEGRAEWSVCAERRGVARVEVAFVGSEYPFGFLHKSLAGGAAQEVLVWPAPVEYRRLPVAAWERVREGRPTAGRGQNGDLLALRPYRAGDSHRLIHWKASARSRRLVVREFAADSQEAFTLHVPTEAGVWRHAEQFEVLCSLAATLAEDLFRSEQLEAVAVGAEAPSPVRGVREVEAFLDRLAVLGVESGGRRTEAQVGGGFGAPGGRALPSEGVRRSWSARNVMTFAPEGARGVSVFVNDEKAATA